MNYKSIQVLKDNKLQSELDKKGFVCVDFLGATEVDDLKKVFSELHANRPEVPYDVLHTCQHSTDIMYRNEMNLKIEKIISPKLSKIFQNIQNTSYTFQIKGIGPKSELFVHQDWSFSREDDGCRTYTFWIPLVKSTTANGTLSVIPGSHRTFDCIRGARVSTSLTGHEQNVLSFMKPLTIEAGQLLLFDSALVHYSSANLSPEIRVSVMTNIIAGSCSMCLYFPSEENPIMITEYEVPTDFFLRYRDYKKEYERPPQFGVKIRDLVTEVKPFEDLWPTTTPNNKLFWKFKLWIKQLTDEIL